MKTERDKVFEKYVMSLDKFKNRKTAFVFQLDENGDYDNRDVYDLHHAWQASASREGYKLVPVEPTKETYIKYIGARIEAKDLGLYDMQFFNHVYKTMISAAD